MKRFISVIFVLASSGLEAAIWLPEVQALAAISCRLSLEAPNGPFSRLGKYFAAGSTDGESILANLQSYLSGASTDFQTLDSRETVASEIGQRAEVLLSFIRSGGADLRATSIRRAADLLFADWSDEIGSFLNDFSEVSKVFTEKLPALQAGKLATRHQYALTPEEKARDQSFIQQAWERGRGPGPGSRNSRWARPSVRQWSDYPLLIQTGEYLLEGANFEGIEDLVKPALRSMLTVTESPDRMIIVRGSMEDEGPGPAVISLNFFKGPQFLFRLGMFKTDQSDFSEESFALVEMDMDIDSIPLDDQLLIINSDQLNLRFGSVSWQMHSIGDQ